MPTQSDRLKELREGAADDELPYISKSRVTTYKTCPRKFYYQYIRGMRTPDTFYTKRGRRVHRAVEIYYENVLAEYEDTSGVFADLTRYLPEDSEIWADFTEPFITNFLLFEYRRRDHCASSDGLMSDFPPVGIEAEGWDDDMAPPWMGYADVLLQAGSLPELEADDGVVIVDLKTGKTPDEKYRDEGIFLEGEYYAMLFEDDWDIAAVAGYYPKNDDLIVSPLNEDRRQGIRDMVERMQSSREMEDFPLDEQPLCKWGEGEENQCDFYNICSTRWGKRGGCGPTYRD